MIVLLIKSMRPKQWTKNVFIFAGLIFSGNLLNFQMTLTVVYAFIFFSILAGITYIINDLADLENDKAHPKKTTRPLASGKLSPGVAITFVVIVTLGLLATSFFFNVFFQLTTLTYFILFLAYSFFLKHIVIIDVFVLSAAYFLRVLAGTVVINVEISPWLVLCTILLALFLGICKRRHELILLDVSPKEHRKTLDDYSTELLDQMIAVVTSSTIIAYSLYTFTSPAAHKTNYLMSTIPFVLFGIFRYLFLIYKKDGGGSPTDLVLGDKQLLGDMGLWLVAVTLIVYLQ